MSATVECSLGITMDPSKSGLPSTATDPMSTSTGTEARSFLSSSTAGGSNLPLPMPAVSANNPIFGDPSSYAPNRLLLGTDQSALILSLVGSGAAGGNPSLGPTFGPSTQALRLQQMLQQPEPYRQIALNHTNQNNELARTIAFLQGRGRGFSSSQSLLAGAHATERLTRLAPPGPSSTATVLGSSSSTTGWTPQSLPSQLLQQATHKQKLVPEQGTGVKSGNLEDSTSDATGKRNKKRRNSPETCVEQPNPPAVEIRADIPFHFPSAACLMGQGFSSVPRPSPNVAGIQPYGHMSLRGNSMSEPPLFGMALRQLGPNLSLLPPHQQPNTMPSPSQSSMPMMNTNQWLMATLGVRQGSDPRTFGDLPTSGSSDLAQQFRAGQVGLMPLRDESLREASATNLTENDNSGNTGPRCFPLHTDEDQLYISAYQYFVRRQIEVFEATDKEANTNAQGRNRAISRGQVGIRCRHCGRLEAHQRAAGAVYFPNRLDGVYQTGEWFNIISGHSSCDICSLP